MRARIWLTVNFVDVALDLGLGQQLVIDIWDVVGVVGFGLCQIRFSLFGFVHDLVVEGYVSVVHIEQMSVH